jgi:hypothetical protein
MDILNVNPVVEKKMNNELNILLVALLHHNVKNQVKVKHGEKQSNTI